MTTAKTVAGTKLAFEQLFIPSDTPGIDLHVRNKRPAAMTEFSGEKTIFMVHGASYSSGSLYDVPFGGLSFMDYLAAAGYDVYGLDVRGYGLSSRPPEMEQPADENPPVGNTDVAVADFATAVDYMLERRGIEKVNVFGMSWGGTVAGAYTSANNDKVHKLSLLAPQWVSEEPIPIDPGGQLDSYRLIPVRDGKMRWLNTAPEHARDTLIPEGWFEQWADATLAEDPWSTGRAPDLLRAANGPIQDLRDYWGAFDGALNDARRLTQEFAKMVREHEGEKLDGWLAEAASSEATVMNKFAAGLKKDLSAVRAGLTESWSTGPVEGFIHKLKLIKRQGYGRANVDLLRARALAA